MIKSQEHCDVEAIPFADEGANNVQEPALQCPFTLQWEIRKLTGQARKSGDFGSRFKLSLDPSSRHTIFATSTKDTCTTQPADLQYMPGERALLDDIHGEAGKGEMWAIMGASGAGKSTLLDCISLRNQRFEGQVLLNGQPVSERYFSTTAYVHQDDLFFATLTVREHLTFHAMVRVPDKVAIGDRLQRVDQVLDAVNLRKCANSLIGGVQVAVRGISGGERKRLSVATELLSDPDIIFADEPTSGLDASMALSVCKIFQELASKGKLAMCVIHQPSSEIFELFTHLLLLSRGQVAYAGRREEAVSYFSKYLGLPCPPYYNPADYLVEKLAVNILVEKPEVPMDKIVRTFKEFDHARRAYSQQNRTTESDQQRSVLDTLTRLPQTREFPATVRTQFVQSYRRTLKSYAREPVLARVRFGQALSMGLILGLVYLHQGPLALKNRIGALFMLTMNQSIASIFTVSQVIPREMTVFMREYLTAANRPSAYFLGLSLAELPYQILFPCLFGSISYWLIGFARSISKFFTFLSVLILVANASCSLGYALSTLTGNEAVAVAIGPVIMLPMSLYAGVLHSSCDAPWYFYPLNQISFVRYAFQALVLNEFRDNAEYPPSVKEIVLRRFAIQEADLPLDIGMLAVLLVAFRLLAYFFLAVRARRAVRI